MKLPRITTIGELYTLVEEIGFLPYFSNEMSGFSLMDITRPDRWWSEDERYDPWEWSKLAASEGRIAYGKVFHSRAGFISREWLPVFVNYRRRGYDYDALYEEGLASHRSKLIMKLFEPDPDAKIPSFEIKRLAGFGKDGERGYEGALTALEMQTYLTICGFARKRNKTGAEYGWAVGVLSTMESRFGGDFIRSRYSQPPEDSLEEIAARMAVYVTDASDGEIKKYLK